MIPEWRDRISLRGAEDSQGTHRVEHGSVCRRQLAKSWVRLNLPGQFETFPIFSSQTTPFFPKIDQGPRAKVLPAEN